VTQSGHPTSTICGNRGSHASPDDWRASSMQAPAKN
jgi:hypothetical protein